MTDLIPRGSGGAVRYRYLVRGDVAPVFVERNALAAADAIAFVPGTAALRRQFAALVRDGAIRHPRAGVFYFDYAAYEAAAKARSRRRAPLLAIVAVTIAAVATRFYVGG